MGGVGGTVLITGGGGGIGSVIALAFARLGHDVVITGRDEVALAAARRRLAAAGPGTATGYLMDARVTRSVDAVFERIAERAALPLRTLVTTLAPTPSDVDDAEVDQLLGADLSGVLGCCLRAFTLFEAHAGCAVVAVAPTVSPAGLGPLIAHAAARAGLDELTRTLAAQWAPSGVRINAIGPGRSPTPPQRLARTVTFLASSRLTGRTIAADTPLTTGSVVAQLRLA